MGRRKVRTYKDIEKVSTKDNVRNKLYPALKNTKEGEVYGYINNTGRWVISPQFTRAYDYNQYGIAIVQIKDKFGIINNKGEFIVYATYDCINEYKEGRAIYSLNSKMGVFDEKGKLIKINDYNFIGDFYDERAIVSVNEDQGISKYGYIDKSGKEIIEPKFSNANNFKDKVALVKVKDDIYALIGKMGNVINVYHNELVSQYGDNLMVFANSSDGPYGYINEEGKVVIEPIFTMAEGFNGGVAIVSDKESYNGPFGVINKEGKYVYETIYNDIKYLDEKRLALGMEIGEKGIATRSIYAIGDDKGNILTLFKYLVVGDYKDGLAYVSDSTNTFFLDNNGQFNNSLPSVKGSGQLYIKDNIVFADIDYSPYYLTKNEKVIYEPNKFILLSHQYSLIKCKYKPNINYLIYIPEIKGVKNKKIEKQINLNLKHLSYFDPTEESATKKEVIITKDDVLAYDYFGSFNVKYYSNDILTLELSGYYYPLGAAHGMPNRKTPTINLRTGDFYTVGNLFMGGIYWVGELNKIITTMINTDPQYDYVFKDQFKGINVNQDFYIDNNNLYIYFQPYEIGPYAAGYITFKIPFIKIEGMINKNSDFYKNIF